MSHRQNALTQGLWGIINTGVIRMVTFISQIILAILLNPDDFGVYAIALAVSSIALTIRGAGLTQWQIEGGERHHAERSVNAFWLALVWNLSLGAAVVAAAKPLGDLFNQSDVGNLIVIIGLSFPLQTLSGYFSIRMQIQLRIKELTIIELTSMIVRSAVMIGGAASGLGAYAFVLPVPVCYVLEAILGYRAVREAPWRAKPDVRRWPAILRQTISIMVGTAAVAVGLQGDYVVLGALAPVGAVGIYYFAYQLTLQTAGLISTNINRVFTSVLVSTRDAGTNRRFLEATNFIMLGGSPVVLLLAAGMAPLEHLVWHGKWEDAILAVFYLSLGLPLYLLATSVQSLLLSDGKFRRWMILNAVKACVVVVSAVIAGRLTGGNGGVISAVMAVGLASAHIMQIGLGLRRSGISARSLWSVSWVGTLVAPAALILAYTIIQFLRWPDLAELVVGPALLLAAYLASLCILRRDFLRAAYTMARARPSAPRPN